MIIFHEIELFVTSNNLECDRSLVQSCFKENENYVEQGSWLFIVPIYVICEKSQRNLQMIIVKT